MKGTLKPPTIPEDEKSPIVLQLLAFVEQQASIIHQQGEWGHPLKGGSRE